MHETKGDQAAIPHAFLGSHPHFGSNRLDNLLILKGLDVC